MGHIWTFIILESHILFIYLNKSVEHEIMILDG